MTAIFSHVEMLVRRPTTEVFNAFVQPQLLEKFWLKSASAPLEKHAVVKWEFMVEGAHETVTVTEFVTDQKIAFTWSDGIEVELAFEPRDNNTKVSITTTGFKGKEAATQAIDATEGFSIVICDLKSLLETGQSGNMVRDKAALISARK